MTTSCPKCQATEGQIRHGYTTAGSQRYQCKGCGYRYTPQPKERGYSDAVRLEAVRLSLEGMSQRAIGRKLSISQQSVGNWLKAYVSQLPDEPLPERLEVTELDELFTFVGSKKTKSTSSQP